MLQLRIYIKAYKSVPLFCSNIYSDEGIVISIQWHELFIMHRLINIEHDKKKQGSVFFFFSAQRQNRAAKVIMMREIYFWSLWRHHHRRNKEP